MSTTRFGDAVTALIAAYRAAAPLAGITVYDGPDPTSAADNQYIIVGHDGTLEPDGSLATITEGGTIVQAWSTMGPPAKEETGLIRCVAVSQTGDAGDLPARRASAEALLVACEDAALNAGDVSGILFDATTDARFLFRQLGQGCAAIIAFTCGYSVPW